MQHRRDGFTLLEISIVITIIALLIGGILVGRDMLRSSQVRAVISEAQNLMQSIRNFQSKYDALPGDFAGASNIWAGNCDSNNDGAITVADTGNGDGNGRIITQGTAATYPEQYCAWSHLRNAGMIDGNYTGIRGALGGQHRIPGTNIPASQLQPAGWALVSVVLGDGNNVFNQLLYNTSETPPNHVLWFGGTSTAPAAATTNNMQGVVLTANEAYTIDSKLDDGMPGMGKVMAQDNTPTVAGVNAATDCHSSISAYNLTTSNPRCALVFKTGF